ncbi:hypothetical protein IRJ41_017339, partial [Triplophysa rosa]
EELLQRLTEVSIRQQQITEHLASWQGQTEMELEALRTAAARWVPLPDPRVQVTQLLTNITAHDDVESFLQMFETTATREGCEAEDWAWLLAPLLTGEAQKVYFSLPTEVADVYTDLKREILASMGLSPICVAQLFHNWEYWPHLPALAHATERARLAQHWLLEGEPTAAKVAERVVVDRLLRALPRSYRQAVGMRNPATITELVEAVELADATHHRDTGERAPPPFPRRVVQEQRMLEGTFRPVSSPAAPTPPDEPMPTEGSTPPVRTWLTGCIVHHDLPAGAPKAEVKVNKWPFTTLLDSGSTVSLVQTHILSPRGDSRVFLPITCVHGETRHVPARRVTISADPGTWPVEVGVVKDLPVSVLLGRDWPGFERLLTSTIQPASQRWSRRRKTPGRGAGHRSARVASDSGRDGEPPFQNRNM